MKRYVGGLALLALLLAGCGGGVDAPGAEQAFLTAAGKSSVKAMCGADVTAWPCFYDGVESKSDYLVIKLSPDAGSDADALAKATGTAWFNSIHCKFPDLDAIVVNVDGIEHNVFRSDTKADLIKC